MSITTKPNLQTSFGSTVEQQNRTAYQYEVERGHKFLFISDVHYDSLKCDRALLKKHLDRAEEESCSVFVFGDWFDLMGGKYDPRSTYSDIRPEYKSITYLDDVIEDSFEFLKRYNCVKFIGRGNHETNIEKRLHTSPLDRLAQLLKSEGKKVTIAGYSGWIKIRVIRAANSRRRSASFINFHHGSGGNAKRSKGVLEVDLNQMQFPDANLIIRGHTHQKWHVPVTVDRINRHLRPYQCTTHHIQTGSYKRLGDRFAGWATEKGFLTPRLGGWWASVDLTNNDDCRWTIFEAN